MVNFEVVSGDKLDSVNFLILVHDEEEKSPSVYTDHIKQVCTLAVPVEKFCGREYRAPEVLVAADAKKYLDFVYAVNRISQSHMDVENGTEKIGILSDLAGEGRRPLYFEDHAIFSYYLYEDEATALSRMGEKQEELCPYFLTYIRPYLLVSFAV